SSNNGVYSTDGSTWTKVAELPAGFEALNLTKSDIGLGNVDNTSDLEKPLSTLQEAALDARIGPEGAPVDYSGEWFHEGNQVLTAEVDETGRAASVGYKDGSARVGSGPLVEGRQEP
ncbi:hypothetical protein, partial [Roseivivax isoporae]|uniref:hypothetical protein n=1 Tax=Roseivivax isoporae TaxID=591206 RepID=UPI0005C23312